jgi:menaquinone-specific isochorismate synthase
VTPDPVSLARGMRVETEVLDGSVDPVAIAAGDDGFLWMREGEGFAACGRAIELPAHPAVVAEVLGALAHGGDHRPLAIGALPFAETSAGSLFVPALVVYLAPGQAPRVVRIDGAELPDPPPASGLSPDSFTLTSGLHHKDWCERVERTVKAIRDGRFEKAVLAREVTVEANRPFDRAEVLRRLLALHPGCRTFSIDGFIGATPELLVSRRGAQVVSHPLAGTIGRSGDPEADQREAEAMLASAKEREEHAHVIEAVAQELAPWCDHLDVPDGPGILPLRNVSHLATRISGTLRPPWPDALTLALALHPTPAVGGAPTEAALAHLAEVEGLDRGRYAGPVGWVDAAGDGDWYVGIRSAEVAGDRARMIAGVGVVADSDPDAELIETQLKLQALLAALVRP